MPHFWTKKYSNPDVGGDRDGLVDDSSVALDGAYIRGTDAMGNHGFIIGFQHVPTARRVRFKAFITAFNETYKSNWNSEAVFGRGDPIHMFKNTERTISLGWKIPAASVSEGYENLYRLQQFIQFLYPTYTDVQGAQTINQSPLVRVELMNLLRSRDSPDGDAWEKYRSPAQSREIRKGQKTPGPDNRDWGANAVPTGLNGVLGVINSVSIAHNLETDMGVFERGITETQWDGSSDEGASARILPKLIEVQMDFAVIHEHPLGWQGTEDPEFGADDGSGKYFPYGVSGEGTPEPLPTPPPPQSHKDQKEWMKDFLDEEDPDGGVLDDALDEEEDRRSAEEIANAHSVARATTDALLAGAGLTGVSARIANQSSLTTEIMAGSGDGSYAHVGGLSFFDDPEDL